MPHPPALPLTDTLSAHKLALVIREARELQIIDSPAFAVRLSERIYPTDVRKALQFVNLADPNAHNATAPTN